MTAPTSNTTTSQDNRAGSTSACTPIQVSSSIALAPSGAVKTRKGTQQPLNFAAQKEIWNLEQEIVAAMVHVEPDPAMDRSVIGTHHHPLFHLVRDNHKDIFSFSTTPELYGGVDVSFPVADPDSDHHDVGSHHPKTHDEKKEQAVAVYVVVDRRTMKVVYHDHVFFDLDIPYIPTYLAFREIAPLELLVQRQIQNNPQMTPQAILVDGNGVLHPRHAGIACFLGTRTDIPTIGIGKSLLYEGGWTRESLDEAVDDFIRDLYGALSQNQHLVEQLSRYRGLILKKSKEANPTVSGQDGDVDTSHADSAPTLDRKKALQELASYCNGIGIPLTVEGADDSKPRAAKDHPQAPDAIRFPVLGCALVGHGGQIAATSRSQPTGGSAKPILVSVGHKISLQEAVQVTASLSLARIPEPVRQADLYGRELMRRKAAAKMSPILSSSSS